MNFSDKKKKNIPFENKKCDIHYFPFKIKFISS